MKLRLLLVLALAGAHGVVPLGHVAEPLRPDEAVARGLASNPSFAAKAADVRAVQARGQREWLPTPDVVGGELENVDGTGSLNGIQSTETTLQLGLVLEPGGKRAARYRRRAEGIAYASGDTPAISTAS